jgi:S1-C subfamily serine protease
VLLAPVPLQPGARGAPARPYNPRVPLPRPLLCACLLLAALAQPAAAQQLDPAVLARARAATVLILTTFTNSEDYVTGSGVVIDPAGTVLTCAHVVSGDQEDEDGKPEKLTVQRIIVAVNPGTPWEAVYPARVVASGNPALPDDSGKGYSDAKQLDLCLLHFDSDEPLTALPLAAGAPPGETTEVWALGYPLGLDSSTLDGYPEISVRAGSVSALRHNARGEVCVVEHSAMLELGSSGGPLITADGSVAGINTWALGDYTSRAISALLARRFLDDAAQRKH